MSRRGRESPAVHAPERPVSPRGRGDRPGRGTDVARRAARGRNDRRERSQEDLLPRGLGCTRHGQGEVVAPGDDRPETGSGEASLRPQVVLAVFLDFARYGRGRPHGLPKITVSLQSCALDTGAPHLPRVRVGANRRSEQGSDPA